jgi:hypothetical protein
MGLWVKQSEFEGEKLVNLIKELNYGSCKILGRRRCDSTETL